MADKTGHLDVNNSCEAISLKETSDTVDSIKQLCPSCLASRRREEQTERLFNPEGLKILSLNYTSKSGCKMECIPLMQISHSRGESEHHGIRLSEVCPLRHSSSNIDNYRLGKEDIKKCDGFLNIPSSEIRRSISLRLLKTINESLFDADSKHKHRYLSESEILDELCSLTSPNTICKSESTLQCTSSVAEVHLVKSGHSADSSLDSGRSSTFETRSEEEEVSMTTGS